MNDEVLAKMTRIANRYIKAWKTDFTNYDIDKYNKSMNGTEFIWIVRPCGTHFLNIPKQFQMLFGPMSEDDFNKEQSHVHKVVDYYKDGKNRFYHVVKGKLVKKVSRDYCLALCKEKQ